MIISHQHKYLFVEVPSTGSTAISKELRDHYDGQLVLYKHANYSEFRRIASKPERKYFTFAGVRNPLDHVVSHYIRLKNNHRGIYTEPKEFERNGGWIPDGHLERFEFVQAHDAGFPEFFKRFYTSVYNEWVLLGHRQFDFVLRFENLQEDFATVLKMMRIEQVQALPVVNKTDRQKHFSEYYTPDIYQLAARVFGPFMKKWGYEFPTAWGVTEIPLSSRINFAAVDRGVNLVARFASLNPYNPLLQNVKGTLRRLRIA